ncbi:Sterile alpha motif domain-containing protein 9-like [Stylophora pistillata]|uniref:Sterile alpha motif domain-containing protein 9-like n=2 Tax=Stylophora pistillata TaxID=50429 RepID=A0A2B4RP81_STYPI|nr:Sterile alpha motif domain-containing protein 9-like [Stylophora pistillata]
MDINPNWSNQPSDAVTFDKGKMKLSKDEQVSFNKGNIKEWDFSLMTTVLLYSKSCVLEIVKREGYEAALKELKKCRNKLLGHPSTDAMSDAEFSYFWPLLSKHFITLGADPKVISEMEFRRATDLVEAEYYRDLFRTERDSHFRCEQKLDDISKKLDVVMANQAGLGIQKAILSQDNVSSPEWDEWLRFCDAVGDFDSQKNQYILAIDNVPNAEIKCYSNLRSVAWKMILDFDLISEEEGFYHEFTSKEEQMSNLVSMFTPAELKQSTMRSLVGQIDPRKTQWLFVKGRAGDDDDRKCEEFSDWEATAVKDINSLLRCCSDPDMFDELKPVVCLILPFNHHSLPFLEVTMSRLIENFNKHKLTFVSVNNRSWKNLCNYSSVQAFHLCPKILDLGLREILGTSADQKLRMPTSHAGVPVHLSRRQYLYIKEYLEVLYLGCEDLPEDANDPTQSWEQQERYLEEQRKSFLSGNEISFASLFDNHDARRQLERDIQVHVQRLLDQGLFRPIIVEIRHSPGTGATTIARRVLWDLHSAYPCLVTDVDSHRSSDEDNDIARKLAERISSIEEICNTPPLILIDGKQSGSIEGLSNKLSRILQSKGKRALLLRCIRGMKESKKAQESCHVHKVFHVNVKLEESVTDLHEFKSKYKEYLDSVDKSLNTRQILSGLCRVFHFPLLAMMQEFRPKLEKIIEDTFNELRGTQQEIAAVVAFLQKYANLPTPAILLHEAFKQFIRHQDENAATYDDIKQLFSDYLMNLMIPAKPTPSGKENPPESYTFQHPLVADLILKRVYQEQKRDLFEIVDRFLQFPIYQQETLLPLLNELFIYNKVRQGQTEKLKFSLLFEELKSTDSDRAADIFCKAAEKINQPVMYANAARFCARKDPPSFPKAKELIQRALKVHDCAASKAGYKNLCHTKGVVLHFELKHKINFGEVQNLEELEEMASKVLEAHREARNFPPTYPHPLIGEVEVWLECITWIMKNMCDNDAQETLIFVTTLSPPFFRTCLSDSFHLLDVVDGIVQSVSQLADPEETKRLSSNLRLSLMKTFRSRSYLLGRPKADEDIVQACKAICTTKNFRESSQLELKRLQAHFLLTHSEAVDSFKQENLEFLLKLLEDLVLKENEYSLAHHLIKVCMLVTGTKCYTLQQGLHVCDKWLSMASHDCLPSFYQMVICFLQILDGNTLDFMPKYIQALQKCREKSQNHLKKFYATLYVGKEGHGMSRFISRNALLRGDKNYFPPDNFEKVSKFWQVESRMKLKECKGRIREKESSRGKSHLCIELVQGNLELYVGKNADIGKVQMDFTPGALVYFVVSFNLQGPVANGITFSPQDSSNES